MTPPPRRLLPFLGLLALLNVLDRANLAIAILTMKTDVRISDGAYGFGVGIFFLGYCGLEVPSNLVLERIGARIWIARIMVSWGAVSAAMMFVTGPWSFYALRLLLGVAEAGFFPGVIYYMTLYYAPEERARAVSRFAIAVPAANIVGGPLADLLLRLDGVLGLHGWQWIFLAEGVPSIVLGLFTLRVLPEAAPPAERGPHVSLRQAFGRPAILRLCAVYFCYAVGAYSVQFWVRLILKARSDWSTHALALIGTVPSAVAVIAMVIVGARSDRTGERRGHVSAGLAVAALGFVAAALFEDPVVTLIALSVASGGLASTLGPFWALTTAHARGAIAAGTIAWVNSLGNLGGFAGPTALGELTLTAGMFAVAGAMLLGAALVRATPADTAG